MQLSILYLFYALYFMTMGSTGGFTSIFYEEIGMNNTQIGMLMSLPVLVGMFAMPLWGIVSDHAKKRRHVITFTLLASALFCFMYDMTDNFVLLMLIATGTAVFSQPINPLSTSLSLEYTARIGRSFGPIRMSGSIGYQIAALLTGMILATSMRGLYRMVGFVTLCTAALSFFLPSIAGHQSERSQARVSPLELLRDRRVVLLLLMVFIGTITTMFYQSFFAKHFSNCGASNTMVGVMYVLSVGMELPFLFFSNRLYKKLTVWQWLLLGMAVNAVRWIGIALTDNVFALLLLQLPGVIVLMCFEFFPALYLSERVTPGLLSTVQTTLNFVAFGVARVVGSLLGGALSDRIGIANVFGVCGLLLLAGIAAFYIPSRRMSAADRAEGTGVQG